MVKPGYKQTEVGVIPEDWDVLPMHSLTSLMTNGFVGTIKSEYVLSGTGVLYLQGFNIQENAFDLTGVTYVSQEFHQKHLKSELKKHDLLTVQTGEIGVTAFLPEEYQGANCQALIISRFLDNYDARFWSYYFNSIGRKSLTLIETGTTMKHINVGDMKEVLVPVPALKAEQTRVAETLSDVDQMIATFEKLLLKKKAIKQGAMQELLTSKKRLPGFSEEWKTIPLTHALTVGHGMSQHNVESPTGKYPILATGGEIGKATTYLWDKPSVLIGRKGTINKPQYMDKPFWSIDTLFYTKIKEGYCPKFLYYVFCQIDWLNYNEASGVPSLSAKTVESIEVQVPEHAEQLAIAELLSEMDSEIEALEQKLEKYRQIKQGMMQQLLTGKIRLV